MKLLTILVAVLFVGATPASARIVAAWKCSADSRSEPITVELHKWAVHVNDLRFVGIPYVYGHGYNFEFVGEKGAKLNGKPCKILPYDPKWDEDD